MAVERLGDRLFRGVSKAFGLGVLAVTAALALLLVWNSRLVWREFGVSFLTSDIWNPAMDEYGALPFIYGTLVSSALALAFALPLGLGCAIFLTELAPKRVASAATFGIELLAAIPSVVLGLMGVFILVPAVRAVEPWLVEHLGFLPLFRGAPYGVGMLTAALILTLMILPYIVSVAREVLLAVPRSLKEAMLALGATRWEVVRKVSLPFARSGIVAGVFLALGRALGETMAVTMVIGNTPTVSASLLEPGYSMAAVLANEFNEAFGDLNVHALIGIGLVLFVLTLVINAAARWVIYRVTLKGAAA